MGPGLVGGGSIATAAVGLLGGATAASAGTAALDQLKRHAGGLLLCVCVWEGACRLVW